MRMNSHLFHRKPARTKIIAADRAYCRVTGSGANGPGKAAIPLVPYGYIDAWVFLHDHRHAIWTLPAGDDQYSNRWRAIKKAFSKTIPNTEYRSAIRIKRSERGIWQRRFWEHTILDDADYAAHKDYIHHKPVKHGWAVAVKGWPYSSFLRLVKMDIYPLTWTWLDLALLEPGEPDN